MKVEVEKELKIILDSDSFKDQKEHLIKAFDVSAATGDDILELIRKYVLEALVKENKKWSEDVKDTFINMVTTIFIELMLVIGKKNEIRIRT